MTKTNPSTSMADENNQNGKGAADNGAGGDDAAAKAAAEAKAKADAEAAANNGGDKSKQDMVPHQAFHEEREKRKAAEAELAKIAADKKAAEEADMAKRGEHEKLLEQKNQEVKTLTDKLTDVESKLSVFKTNAEMRVEEALKAVTDEEQRGTLKEVLDKYDITDRETMLPKLLKTMGIEAKDVNGSAKQTADSSRGNAKGSTLQELEKALETEKDPMKVLNIQTQISQLKRKK